LKKSAKKGNLFLGIDLGGKENKTTAFCILDQNGKPLSFLCQKCQDFYGKEILNKISPFLKEIKTIAIDAPLTRGRGKGKFRLFEKFLSMKPFKKERVSPLPPAFMPELCDFALETKEKLKKEGFVLDLNLIEVFPTLILKICKKKYLYNNLKLPCQTKNQKMAFVSAKMAFWHFHFETRYLGYKDGFLFLPKIDFWKIKWQEKFKKLWKEKPHLKYYRLKTNIF